MEKNKVNYKLINITLIFVIIFLLCKTSTLWSTIINKIISIASPFVIAFAIAYALYPLLRKMVSKKIPKPLAIFIIVALLVGFITLMVYLIIPILVEQLQALSSLVLTFIQDISTKYEIDLKFLQKDLMDVNSILSKFGESIGNISMAVINTAIDIITFTVITFITFIYFLADMDKIRERVKKFLKRKNKKTFQYVRKIDDELSKYFVGLGKCILIQFVEYTVIFFIIGHPYYLLLGVLCSVTTIIPYFGGIFSNIIAAVTAFFISKNLFILTLIVALVCPNIDGYIISPKVYGKSNNVPALLTIFSVFAGGILYGMWGIVIALPLTIVLLSTYHFYEDDIQDKLEDMKSKKDETNAEKM